MTQQTQNQPGQLEAPPPLPVYYMKLTMAHADARLGKMPEGTIVPMDQAIATRYLSAGVAVQATEAEYREKQDRRAQKQSARQEAFRAINDGHAMWDVSTYRDVLTAPEGGLRLAYERGIPLVNVHMLRDEDGDPLPPDADIEDILDARDLLHADLSDPMMAHDRSSVMGGGSPFTTNVPIREDGPMPLSPRYRAMADRINEHEQYAQTPTARQLQPTDRRPLSGRQGRAALRDRTLRHDPEYQAQQTQNQQAPAPPAGQPMTAPEAPPPPIPQPPPPADGEAARKAGTVSPDADAQGKAAGATKPAKPASGDQIGN